MTERPLYSEFAEKGRGSNTDNLGLPPNKTVISEEIMAH